jgi:hypothetical protein
MSRQCDCLKAVTRHVLADCQPPHPHPENPPQPLQVTNPAIDPFREAVVTSLRCFIGPEGDITTCAPSHAKRLELAQPILTLHEMAAMKIINAKVGRVWYRFFRFAGLHCGGFWPAAAKPRQS